MGKDKTKDRKKAQTSSSSGASSLLSGTGFIGFSDVVSSCSSRGGGGGESGGGGGTFRSSFGGGGDVGLSSSSAASATPFYTGGDPDLQVICRRLIKKDQVTKHKALLELAQLVQARGTTASSASSVVEGLVPFWLYVYPRLVLLEDGRRVREAVFSTVVPQLFAADRKAMVGVLGRHLLGPWWAAMSDPQKEVASAATRAFQTVFPRQAKRCEVLTQAAPMILGYLHNNLHLKPADAVLDTSGGSGSSPEEAKERLERIVTCSLTAIVSLLNALDEHTRARLLNNATMMAAPPPPPPRTPPTADSSSIPAAFAVAPAFLLIDGQSSSLEDVFRDRTNWRFLSDTRPLVRRAAYGLMAAVAERADHVIRQTGQVGIIAQQVCGLLSEKETANFGNMWEAVLLFFNHFPEALTTTLDCTTQLFPRVLTLVRANFLGAAQASCPSLLPLVALVQSAAAGTSFYTDLLEALWKGAKADKSDGEEPYLVAIIEIATFLLVRQPAQEGEIREVEKRTTFSETPVALLGAEGDMVMVGKLLAVLAKVLTREGWAVDGPASTALVTALTQLEKAGVEGKRGRKCLLLELKSKVWQGIWAVALRVLGLEASEGVISTDWEAAGLISIQAAKTSQETQTRSMRLYQLLTAAYEKGLGSTASLEAVEEEWGLEGTLRFLFWQCILHCEARKDQHGDVLVPYLSLTEAVILRLPFGLLASAAPSSVYASTSSFVVAFLIPILQTTVEAAGGELSAIGMIKPLVGIITTLNLELGEAGCWQELLDAVTPTQDRSGAGGLGLQLDALEVTSATYERVKASVGAQKALPALNSLLSAAVAPYALALIEGKKAAEAKEEHVQFLAMCLGVAGKVSTTDCSKKTVQRRWRTRQQPLLVPAAVELLVEQTLACQHEIGLEALVLALDKGDQDCPVLDVVRSQAAAILTMAFQKLGAAGDVRIASVLSMGDNGEDEAEEERGEKQGSAQVGTSGFRHQGVFWLRSLLACAVGPQQEQKWADDFVRLVEILSSASHEPASHLIPVLLYEAGLADASLWAGARTQPQELLAMWRCLEAVMHELAEEGLIHAASDAAMVLIRPGASKGETVSVIHEVLRAGVELGERVSMTVPVPGRSTFAISRFLSATANEDVLPSDIPFQLFFPAGHDDEEEGNHAMTALPFVPWDMADILSQIVEKQLRVVAASLSWANAYLLARVVSLLEAAAKHEVGSHALKPVNETAWSRVVLPKELAVIFDSSDELQVGMEVWFSDKRKIPSSSSSDAATPVPPESAWQRGKVVGVHKDDVDEYLKISKASGGETQMEYSRLRRTKPSDIAGLVAGVCEGLPDLQFVDAIHHYRQHELEGEANQHSETVAHLLIAALTPYLEDSAGARSNIVLAWSAGEILRGLRALASSPCSSPSLQADVEEWMRNLQARWCALAEKALQGAAGKQDWSHVASSLYVLGGLPPLDMAEASRLWSAAVRVGVVSGTKRQQISKTSSAGGEAAPVTSTVVFVPVSEAAQVAALYWVGGLSTACREQPACLEVLEHLWDLQTSSRATKGTDSTPGTLLAALDLGLQTVLEKGSLALPPSTKVPLFRLALQGFTSPSSTATEPTVPSALAHEIHKRCRLLAVALIPFDNRNLDWTNRIYAAQNHSPSSSATLVLNLTLWNADVDALLHVLESEGQWASSGLHMSTFHVLRPYLRSATDASDDLEDSDDEDDESKDTPATAEKGEIAALMEESRAKAMAIDATERRDMARNLRIVGRRIWPTFHRMLQSWVAPLDDGSADAALSSSSQPHPTQRLACLLEWEGVLEAVGEDGAAEGNGVIDINLLDAYRRGVFQALLVWLLFLEHVEGVALSPPLRDAYSTYISSLGALPLLLQACFRILGRRVGSTANTTGFQYEQQDLWATAHALGSGGHLAAPGGGGREMRRLVAYVLFRTIVTFPALVRKWWSSDCERWLSTGIFKFVEEQASDHIVQREIGLLLAYGKGPDCPWGGGEDEIVVRGSAVTREVTAHYFKDDCTLEVLLRLPLAYPLRNVEVECTRSLGVSADKWNRWQLQIVTLLSMRDGSVVDAVALWVRNLQKEFEGMNPCLICTSIIEARNLTLPERECRTCHNKFHNSCILKWFTTSGKNRCVVCQQATIG